MNASTDHKQRLIERLHRLPGGRTPGRDLWPGIQARLTAQPANPAPAPRSWRGAALAASVAIAFTAGIMFGRLSPGPEPDQLIEQGGAPALLAALQASELEYRAAFQVLAPVGLAPAVFESQDIEAIDRSWRELREAEAALMAALDRYPDNAFLGARLLDLRAQQLEFMKQLQMLDQNSRRNI